MTATENVPIHLKVALTIKEAAEYSNIGINKIDSMLRMPHCPFVLYVGTKKIGKAQRIRAIPQPESVYLISAIEI